MAVEDKERWNEKYQDNPMPDEPIKLISDYAPLSKGKKALDIACGMGRHSKYLVSLGFDVDALDISSVAIEQLQNIPNIHQVRFESNIKLRMSLASGRIVIQISTEFRPAGKPSGSKAVP